VTLLPIYWLTVGLRYGATRSTAGAARPPGGGGPAGARGRRRGAPGAAPPPRPAPAPPAAPPPHARRPLAVRAARARGAPPARPAHSDLHIRKSRFIGCVQPASGRAEALAVVARLRAEHPGAAHVCWALLAGGQSAANDDGEPGGTAGRPMLEVLRHQDLEGVLATVVRYYGGIQLGAGGLVRAYTDAVAQALLQAEKTPITPHTLLRCALP